MLANHSIACGPNARADGVKDCNWASLPFHPPRFDAAYRNWQSRWSNSFATNISRGDIRLLRSRKDRQHTQILHLAPSRQYVAEALAGVIKPMFHHAQQPQMQVVLFFP